MRRILLMATALLLLTACSQEWEMPPLMVYPSEEPSGMPSKPPVLLPDGPAASQGFGLAWTPTARLDPFAERDTLNVSLLGLLYEGLFAVDGSFEPRQRLCGSLETEDNRQFILRLREDAVFSDGSPLTAEDVVWSFTQACAAGSRYAQRLSGVESVSAQTDGSVLVSLHAPRARFAALLDFPVVRKAGDSSAAAPSGTGVYVLRYDEEGAAVLSPNPYRKDAETLRPSRVELLDSRDPVNLGFYFQYKHISAIGYDFNDTSQPGIHSGYERYDYSGAALQYIGISAAGGLLIQQPVMRRVVSMALDRASLSGELFNGAEPSLLPVPPSSSLYDADAARDYAYDPIAALQLMSEAGCADTDADGVLEWPDGRKTIPLRFTMLTNAETPARAEAARRLADVLSGIGVELTVETLPWDAYTAAVSEGTYDLFWAQAALEPDFDLGVFLEGGGALSVRGGAASAETVQALQTVRSALDADAPAARRELYRCWFEYERVITVCFNKKSLLTQRGLFETPTPVSENLFFGFADWQLRTDGGNG